MNIKRFFARSSREALTQVRLALGEEAVILSNRAVDGGTEILAVKEQDMDQMIIAQNTPAKPTAKSTLNPNSQKQIDILTRRNPMDEQREATALFASKPSLASLQEMNQQADIEPPSNLLPSNLPSSNLLRSHHESMQPALNQTADMRFIKDELQSMRAMLQSQLTEMSWNHIQQRDPMKSKLLTHMISAGFSASLSRYIAEKAPSFKTGSEANQWLHNVLARNFSCMADERQLLDEGGVFALVGPTGVGKTTTTAKLAARYVMKHGAKNLALITTDAYRIGGHEQLRIYGKILGVMVHSVKDQADLKLALQELKNKHTILIDTVGVSQRDNMVAQQIAMLHGADNRIKKLLCLNATCTGETLSDVTRAYKGQGLAGAILTKLDEAATIGGALDIIIREKLRLHYVADGQRVPEDLHLANPKKLLQLAFKLSTTKQDIYGIQQAELPALMGSLANKPGSVNLPASSMAKALSHG